MAPERMNPQALTAAEVEVHRTRLGAFIRRKVADPDDAEDILQDVFAQLLTSPSVTEPIEQLSAWLYTAAKNRIIDWYRRKKTIPFSEEPDCGPHAVKSGTPAPDEVVEEVLFNETLALALAELPPEQRDVFIRHEINGESFKEIAGSTSVPLNTLLSRKRYAVLHLRERLNEYYDELFT